MKITFKEKKCTGKCQKTLPLNNKYYYSCEVKGKTKTRTVWVSKCKECTKAEKREKDRAKGHKPMKPADKNKKYAKRKRFIAEFEHALSQIEFREPDVSKAAEYKKQNWAAINSKRMEKAKEYWDSV